MHNVTRSAILVLSILALSFAACGDDDDDGGAGGSGGAIGAGGSGGDGTGGTGGDNTGGSGGSGGTGGSGGSTTETACADLNDTSAECEECINAGVEVCRGTTCADDLQVYSVCAFDNGCVVNEATGEVDAECIDANCAAEFEELLNCYFGECAEVLECFPDA